MGMVGSARSLELEEIMKSLRNVDWETIITIVYYVVLFAFLLGVGRNAIPIGTRYYYTTARICYNIAAVFGQMGLKAEAAYYRALP